MSMTPSPDLILFETRAALTHMETVINEALEGFKDGAMALHLAYQFVSELDNAERLRMKLGARWQSPMATQLSDAMTEFNTAHDKLKRLARGEFPLPYDPGPDAST